MMKERHADRQNSKTEKERGTNLKKERGLSLHKIDAKTDRHKDEQKRKKWKIYTENEGERQLAGKNKDKKN